MAKATKASGPDSPASLSQKDAQRVANAVHAYETSRRQGRSSTLPRAPGGGGSVAEATFYGGWVKGATKSVTFTADTMSTAAAVNLFRTIPISSDFLPRTCLISPRPSTTSTSEYILVNAEC